MWAKIGVTPGSPESPAGLTGTLDARTRQRRAELACASECEANAPKSRRVSRLMLRSATPLDKIRHHLPQIPLAAVENT